MYTVYAGEDAQEYQTRKEAIDAAKELSDGQHRPVEIQDESGRESMTYRHGSLEYYVYETRDRRRKR